MTYSNYKYFIYQNSETSILFTLSKQVKTTFLIIFFLSFVQFSKAGNPVNGDSLNISNNISSTRIDNDEITKDCKFKGMNLYGKIKFVTVFPDIKIQLVDAFPDIEVKMVKNFPDRCGLWQEVDVFPDFKVQIVDAFPDIKVKYVDVFPGIK